MFGLKGRVIVQPSEGKTNVLEDKKNILNVKVKNYGDCEFCKDEDNKETLTVPWEIYARWLYLCDQFTDKEWSGVYTVTDGMVSDFRIPKQEISSASVELAEDLGGNGIVHSHHGMGAFHSGQDDKACRNLYDYSVVLSHKGYAASRRRDLPCGGFGYVDATLLVSDIPEDLGIEKIAEKTETMESWRQKNKDDDDTKDKYSAASDFDRRDRLDLWDSYRSGLNKDTLDEKEDEAADLWDDMAEICADCEKNQDGATCEVCPDMLAHIAQQEQKEEDNGLGYNHL